MKRPFVGWLLVMSFVFCSSCGGGGGDDDSCAFTNAMLTNGQAGNIITVWDSSPLEDAGIFMSFADDGSHHLWVGDDVYNAATWFEGTYTTEGCFTINYDGTIYVVENGELTNPEHVSGTYEVIVNESSNDTLSMYLGSDMRGRTTFTKRSVDEFDNFPEN